MRKKSAERKAKKESKDKDIVVQSPNKPKQKQSNKPIQIISKELIQENIEVIDDSVE
jgi:hypothetical protein